MHLDVMDVAGDNQLNIEHDMYKQRISKSGKAIGKPALQIISDVCFSITSQYYNV